MSEQTIFEKIIAGDIPGAFIYQDEHAVAFLDINPFEKGHTLVVPRKPYECVWDMPEEDYLNLQKAVLKVAKKMHEVFPDAGLNIIENNRLSGHQDVPHVHFHVIPRNIDKWLYMHFDNPEYLDRYENDEEKESFVEKLKLG